VFIRAIRGKNQHRVLLVTHFFSLRNLFGFYYVKINKLILLFILIFVPLHQQNTAIFHKLQ